MTETPVAVVGAGHWGRTISAAISVTPGISLAAIVSSQREALRSINPEIPVVSDWREATKIRDVAGFILAIPPKHQTDIAIEMIESRIPVMLEKPMAKSAEDAARIQTAAISHEFCGLVNHLHIFAPAFKDLLGKVSRTLGPSTIYANAGAPGPYRLGWSPLWDWAGHDFAMVLSVIKSDPIEIRAIKKTEIVRAKQQYQNYLIDLTFHDSSRANLHLGNAFDRKLRDFTVAYGGSEICYRESEANRISLHIDGVKQPGQRNTVQDRPLNAALVAFSERIRNGGGIEDIELGEKVVRLIDAAERSIRLKKRISLVRGWKK